MNAGQMIVQMPLGALLTGALPELSPAGSSTGGEQNAGAFADILGELSAQNHTGIQHKSGSGQLVSTVVSEMKGATVVEEVVSGSMAAMPQLMASLFAGAGVPQQMQSAGSTANQCDEVTDEQLQTGTETPQNVEQSIVGAQIVSAPQVGRMPISEQKSDETRNIQDQPISVSGVAMKQALRPDVLPSREQEQAGELAADGVVKFQNQMPQNVGSREAVAQAILADQDITGNFPTQVFRNQAPASTIVPFAPSREQEQTTGKLPADDLVKMRAQTQQNVESSETVVQAVPVSPLFEDMMPVSEQKSVQKGQLASSPVVVTEQATETESSLPLNEARQNTAPEKAAALVAEQVTTALEVSERVSVMKSVEVVHAVPVSPLFEGMMPVSEQKSVQKGQLASSPVVVTEQAAETESSLPLNEARQNMAPEKAAALVAEQVTTAPEVPERVSAMKSVAVDQISVPQPRALKPEVQVESAVVAEKPVHAHPSGFRFAHSAIVDVALGNGQQVSPAIVEKQGSDANVNVPTAVPQQEVLETVSTEPQFTFREGKSGGLLQQGPEAPHPAAQHIVAGQHSFTAAMSATTSPQTVSDEPSRLILHENIAGQVRERISAHDIKTGSDQIVFRLSPENMGEIKVHLRLEDQRLRVEIVAENRVAREGLIQHMDSLKESLARQNISIDKFSVTSGESQANSQGGNSAQGEWRELVKNRQSQQWMTSGGYRIPSDETVSPRQMYRRGTEHAMLDVHF